MGIVVGGAGVCIPNAACAAAALSLGERLPDPALRLRMPCLSAAPVLLRPLVEEAALKLEAVDESASLRSSSRRAPSAAGRSTPLGDLSPCVTAPPAPGFSTRSQSRSIFVALKDWERREKPGKRTKKRFFFFPPLFFLRSKREVGERSEENGKRRRPNYLLDLVDLDLQSSSALVTAISRPTSRVTTLSRTILDQNKKAKQQVFTHKKRDHPFFLAARCFALKLNTTAPLPPPPPPPPPPSPTASPTL